MNNTDLIKQLLDKAGWIVLQPTMGARWAVANQETLQVFAGDDLAELAGGVLGVMRQWASRDAATIRDLMLDLNDARSLLPEGSRWCPQCESYEVDYHCSCLRCVECGRKLTTEEAGTIASDLPLCGRCYAVEERIAKGNFYRTSITGFYRKKGHRCRLAGYYTNPVPAQTKARRRG